MSTLHLGLSLVVMCVLAAALVGCGGSKGPSEAEAKPFRDAIVEHLRRDSKDMKPETFESLEIQGNKATAKVRMAAKDDLYGLKPLWTFTFAKDKQGKWQVRKEERE